VHFAPDLAIDERAGLLLRFDLPGGSHRVEPRSCIMDFTRSDIVSAFVDARGRTYPHCVSWFTICLSVSFFRGE